MFFSVITKNLNWDTLTKNFKLLLKDRMGLRMKNYNIMGVHWKIWFLVGFTKNQYIAGNLLERGAWTVCRFKGGLEKKRRVVFLREGCWYSNVHYVIMMNCFCGVVDQWKIFSLISSQYHWDPHHCKFLGCHK